MTRRPGGGAGEDRAGVYGDNAYGTGEFQDRLAEAGIESKCKTQPPSAAGGLFTKDAFDVDLDADTVTCPAGQTTPIRRGKNGAGIAEFGPVCADCPLRAQCTKAAGGRSIRVGRHERRLAEARQRQAAPGLDRGLPRHPTQGGTQDRAPDAPPTRRPPSPGPRHHQDRRRLRPARRRGQPGPPQRPRRHRRSRPKLGVRGQLRIPSATRRP